MKGSPSVNLPTAGSRKDDAMHEQLYMTAADVSREMKGELTADGVRKAADRGDLPVALRTAKGMRLFSRSDVEVFRTQRKKRNGRR